MRDGKSGGGRYYGYRVPVDAQGLPLVGELEVVEHEASVIQRIMEVYAAGLSRRPIAAALNEEGVAAPRGGHWKANTIYGNALRGTGILNNELYIGRRVWNRLEYRKDPDTRRPLSRLRGPAGWIRKDVPGLRLVDDVLCKPWKRVRLAPPRLRTQIPGRITGGRAIF